MSEQPNPRYVPEPGYAVPPWWTDPTENVKKLVDAAMARQDDLREMQARYTATIGEMREVNARYIAELRSGHEKELRDAESDRIDAIRAVDVGNVAAAAQVAETRANTLATQVATTADAFRASLASALAPIQASIEDLRRAQYEAQGQKTQVVETRETRGAGVSTIMAAIMAMSVLIALISVIAFVLKK